MTDTKQKTAYQIATEELNAKARAAGLPEITERDRELNRRWTPAHEIDPSTEAERLCMPELMGGEL